MKHVTGSEVLEVGMMKHISYIATSVDDDKTGKTKTVRSSNFKRMAYWMEDTPEFIFVHYVGNDSIAVDFVHGNTRYKQARPHVMTNKSVRDKSKKKSSIMKSLPTSINI